jgi:hypothetical protein
MNTTAETVLRETCYALHLTMIDIADYTVPIFIPIYLLCYFGILCSVYAFPKRITKRFTTTCNIIGKIITVPLKYYLISALILQLMGLCVVMDKIRSYMIICWWIDNLDLVTRTLIGHGITYRRIIYSFTYYTLMSQYFHGNSTIMTEFLIVQYICDLFQNIFSIVYGNKCNSFIYHIMKPFLMTVLFVEHCISLFETGLLITFIKTDEFFVTSFIFAVTLIASFFR